jgi:hypothetical protein
LPVYGNSREEFPDPRAEWKPKPYAWFISIVLFINHIQIPPNTLPPCRDSESARGVPFPLG